MEKEPSLLSHCLSPLSGPHSHAGDLINLF